MNKLSIFVVLFICTTLAAFGQDKESLLFYLSGENGSSADYAIGASTPNFISNISITEDGAVGKALRCGLKQRLAYKAPGNIYSKRGTLAFWWRAYQPYGETEFPIFRVSFADHSSWDMCWLRIDYNGGGFDAFVTDNYLARIRVSADMNPLPLPEEWTHIALSWDEIEGVRFYLNGELAAYKDTCAVLDCGLDQFGPHSRIISPYQVQSAYNMQRGGDIDELLIYNKALSESEVSSLAAGNISNIPQRPSNNYESLKHSLGFDTTLPPVLKDSITTVRKVEIAESYDLNRWWWKACDGIMETTWPGVYNKSRIEGRTDYFILPDSDCYSNSGKQIRFSMPEEPWNHIEISGSAFGSIGIKSKEEQSDSTVIFHKKAGSQHGTYRLSQAVTGQDIIFTNRIQETPIQEFSVYNVHAGDAPDGYARISYKLSEFDDYKNPQLLAIRSYIEGRHLQDARRMLMGIPYSNKNAKIKVQSEEYLPQIHIIIPSDFRDIDINKELSIENPTSGDNWSGLGNTASWRNICGGLDGIRITIPDMNFNGYPDGLIPMNIQIKDPIWEMRNMFDFSFSVKPNKKRVIWLDLRDRILPDDKPLYLTITCLSDGFNAYALKDMQIELVFKDRESAKVEHIADRFNQVRDAHAMLVEEGTANHRYSKFEQIDRDMNDLLRVDPYNKLGRYYWNVYYKGQPGPEYEEPSCPEGMPEWAFIQLELLKRYRYIVEWYIDNRQIENGEFGGGISDDTDLINRFPGLYYCGVIPEKVRNSVHKFMDAIVREGTLTYGLSTIQTDGLHTYEEGGNTLCHINCTETGNPEQAELLMKSLKSLREHVLGINEAGHLHFRSDYFSATEIALEWPWCWSSFREIIHLGPGLLLGEFYGNKGAQEIILQFADSLLEHKRYKDGKVQLPMEICFTTDEERMWGLKYMGALFCYAYHWTGDEKYLEIYKESKFKGKEITKEEMVVLGRKELKSIEQFEYINTEGSVWTDRLRFEVDLIQESRLGGIAMNRTEHMVPLNLVGWKFENDSDAENIAILFGKKERDDFSIDFYNKSRKAVTVKMRGVEVLGGNWELSCDKNKRTVRFGRGCELSIKVPAGKEYHIDMRLLDKGSDFNTLTDLAIAASDININDRHISVTVHNISGADGGNVDIALTDLVGNILSSNTIPAITAPSDLSPKTADITLDLPEKFNTGYYKIQLDPSNTTNEIYKDNNEVFVYLERN